jgi:uncharacterized protein (DUF1800 family)
MASYGDAVRHLLRRAGFGARPDEVLFYGEMKMRDAIDLLIDFEQVDDDVDSFLGQAGYVNTTSRGQFLPNTVIVDARQRWLFRMLHSNRPLQEKMTLFWHNHFATAYSKIAGTYGSSDGTRLMAAKPSEDPVKQEGQLELIRRLCMGNFSDLLVAVAKDPAMIVWLDGRLNTKQQPQENFGRELMELFSMGVGFYTEPDVYAAARVFTGWNLQRRTTSGTDPNPAYSFIFNGATHETAAKTFTFPIYTDGNRTIPARSADAGLQDGLDLIAAVVRHPETARRLVRKLWGFLVSELTQPDDETVQRLADVYLSSGTHIGTLMRRILQTSDFRDDANYFARYSWPAEFVIRSLKEVGWVGFSVNDAVSAMINMGQQLYEPPDVSGWELGPAWVSTSGMLARMNYAATLATNQKVRLATSAKPYNKTPDSVLSFAVDRLSMVPFENAPYEDLRAYLQSAAWTGSDAQLQVKVPGLVHLMVGSGEYVFV